MPMGYYKKGNGDWTSDLAKVGPLKCPKCGNDDRATVKEKMYGPPPGR